MAEFAQLSREGSILQTSPVASRAPGLEAISAIAGDISKVSFAGAESIQKEQSQSSLMNANAQSSTVMTDAKIKMLNEPGRASEILEEAKSNFETIKQAKMSSQDRQKLNYIISGHNDNLGFDVAQLTAKQNKIQNTLNYYEAYNQSMPHVSDALAMGDNETADILSNTISQNARNAVMAGIISPESYEKINSSIIAAHQRAQEIHSIIQKGNASAAEVNIASVNPWSNDNTNISSMPANNGTTLLSNHYTKSMTNQDTKSAILNLNITPDVTASIISQSPEEYIKSVQMMTGSMVAHGTLQSNPPFPEIQEKINLLNGKPNLTTKEDAELQVYKNYMNDLNSGAFWETMGHSVLGSQAINAWNEEKTAANKFVSYALTSEGQAMARERMIANADNNHIDKGVALAVSQHMSPMTIRPIPREIANSVQTVFGREGDPNSAMVQISRLKPRNRGYLALQMKEGNQKEVINAIGLGYDNNMSPTFSSNYIRANKEGQNYSVLKTEDTISDKVLRTQIASNVSDILHSFSIAGGDEAGKRTDAFMDSAVNYVKFRAVQSNDLNLENYPKYIREFSDEMGHAYNFNSRSHGLFNRNQVQLSDAQQDILQNYVYHEAQQNFSGGDNNLVAQAGLMKTDITVYVDQTNHVVAKDMDGNTLFYEPYSNHLLSVAKHFNKPVDMTEEKMIQLQEDIKKHAPFYLGFGAD